MKVDTFCPQRSLGISEIDWTCILELLWAVYTGRAAPDATSMGAALI